MCKRHEEPSRMSPMHMRVAHESSFQCRRREEPGRMSPMHTESSNFTPQYLDCAHSVFMAAALCECLLLAELSITALASVNDLLPRSIRVAAPCVDALPLHSRALAEWRLPQFAHTVLSFVSLLLLLLLHRTSAPALVQMQTPDDLCHRRFFFATGYQSWPGCCGVWPTLMKFFFNSRPHQ